MFRVASTTSVALALLQLSTISTVEANVFLKANSHLKAEHISEEDVQTTLLAEIEGTFGEGSASSRVQQLEAALGPIYAALPKNEQGYLGHATVRYALHRLFVLRHGWSIKGLDVNGGHRNSTSSAGLLKEQVPDYIQDLFEKKLAGRGFGLHELGVLAATVEHLIHSEAVKRLDNAFKVHNFMPTSLLVQSQADDLLDTYMTSYILGEDLSVMNLSQAIELKAEMPEVYMAWNASQEFVRATRSNIMESEASTEQKSSGALDFSLVARVAERVGERFGAFQDQECKQMKGSLVKIEDSGTGRVLLSDFYKPGLDGQWQFQESASYLRRLGALDESNPSRPSVIIANYLTSPSNCIASSSFYSVCCMDECEGLLGHLEIQIAAPEATPARIAKLISELPFSSIVAPRRLPQVLLERLGEIAATHGGMVPLHGRLFAQWMHHAFPRECPYPHLSGTTSPQTPDEWLEATGEETTATEQEMQAHVDQAVQSEEGAYGWALPWSNEEELLVTRPVIESDPVVATSWGRNAVMLMVATSMAFGMVRSTLAPQAATSKANGCEKYLV
jgi:hypothetical protein